MRQQFSRWVPLHLLTLMSLLLNLMPSFAPRTFAAGTTAAAAPVAALLAPSIPDPLVAPFVDPARAALTTALGATDPTMLPNAAPTRMEPLAPVVPAAPAVTRPVQPNPLAHLNSGAPQAAGLDNLTQQRANLAATDTLTPTVSRTTEASRAPPVTPIVSTDTAAVSPTAPAAATVSTSASATSPVTATLAPTAALRLFLPLIQSTNAAPTSAAQETLPVTPEQGGTLRSADGQVELVIPAGAVTRPVTVTYHTVVPSATDGLQSVGSFFVLTAIDADGQLVRHFTQPLTLRVRYADQPGLAESRFKLAFTDAEHPVWTVMPSTVDAQANQVVAQSDHFTEFVIIVGPPQGTITCNFAVDPAFDAVYQAAINVGESLGCPTGDASDWKGAFTQFFANNGVRSAIVAGYYVGPGYIDGYDNAGGSSGILGLPTEHSFNASPAREFYRDKIYDFVGQKIQYYERGFVGQDVKTGMWIGALNFPMVCPGTFALDAETVIRPRDPSTGADLKGTRYFTYTVNTAAFPAPGANDLASFSAVQITPYLNKAAIGSLSMSLDGAHYSYTYSGSQPEDDPVPELSFTIEAYRSGDGFAGYAPAIYESQSPISVPGGWSCPDGLNPGDGGFSPPRDTTPPVIHYMDLFQDGNGLVEVRALVTDNRAVGTVTLTFNGASYPMQDLGGGIYRSGRLQAPRSGTNTYRIHATDTSGNAADFPASGVISVPAGESRSFGSSIFKNGCPCGYTGTAGDPVNTQNGNFTTSATDVTVAGVGETSLSVSRAYNSLAAFGSGGGTVRYTESGGAVTQAIIAGPPQPFGRAWTFDYAVRLLLVDNLVMQGAQVFYPDGRVVSFRREGSGFAPITPFSHDALVAAGSGYELRHKGTLEVEVFDAQGRLVGRRDRNGNPVTLTYAGDRLTSVTNASGRALTFDYNGDGFIAAIHAPEGKSLTYAYTNGDLTSVTDARGNTTTYAYNAQHQLTQITTPEGHPSLRLSYDDQYRVKEQIVGATERHTFSYSADGSLTTLTDANGNQTLHTYDADGRLVATKDALGFTEQYGYDASFNRTKFTDRAGRAFTYTYDDRGNKLTEDGPLGWHRAWAYNALDHVTRAEDALGRATTFTYDARGNLTQVTNALNATSTITYDSRGLPTAVRDFNGNTTTNTYAAPTGDLLTTTNGAGDVVQFTYDGLGRLKTQTNGRGFTTTYTFDGNDNLVQVDEPLGARVRFVFDKNNNRTSATDANGGVTTYGYDASERLAALKNPLDATTRYDYDAMGNLVRVEDAEGRVWTFAYDAVYNRSAEHGPEDTHTFYSSNAVRQVTDIARCTSALVNGDCAVKQVQHLVYDDLDRVITSVANDVPTAPASADTNVTTRFTYDLVGNLLTMTDANGHASTFTYDALNRLIRGEDAAQQVTTSAYDANGNLITLTKPRGFATTFSYDGANRLATSTDALTQTLRFAYDANGNVATLTDPQGIVTRYAYNALDRLEALTQNERPGQPATSEQNVTTRFAYDLNGNLRFVHDPRGTFVTEHRYDLANRRILTLDAEGGETGYAYDKVDNRTSVTDANGHTTTVTFDGLNRRTRLTNAEGHHVDFTYDRLGNLLTLTDARGNASSYRYDGMNRVVTYTDAAGGVWGYTYDAVGNLLVETDANKHATTFAYDVVNRMLSRTDAEGHATSLSYDANGNALTLTDGNGHVTTSTYDALDRLATRTNAENESTAYAYDWQGNQLSLTAADGVVTAYAYDPLYRLSIVTLNRLPNQPASADVNVITGYTYDAAGNMVAIRDGNDHQTRFAFDGLNRLVQETDALGKTWDYTYDKTSNRTVRLNALRQRTTYTYAADDQLARIDYQDGSFVTYTYDENNNRLSVTNPLGTTLRSYDKLNRVTNETDALGRQTAFGYDAVGNRLTLTYPDGRVLTETYAANNWLAATIDPDGRTTSYERDVVGNVVRQVNPNSTVTEQSYDQADRLLTLVNRQIAQHDQDSDDDPTAHDGPDAGRLSADNADQDDDDAHGAILSSFTYVYDEVGQRVEVTAVNEHEDGKTVVTDYTYDPLRRLVREETSDRNWITYRFDAVGNRLELRTGTHREGDDSADEHRAGNHAEHEADERDEDERSPEITTTTASYGPTNQLLTVVTSTRSDDDETSRATNVARVILTFRHEVAAQQGHEITTDGATRLVALADGLLTTLTSSTDEHHDAPHADAVTAALAALRAEVVAQQTSGAILHSHVAASLLGRVTLAENANQRSIRIVEAQTYRYDANGNRVNRVRLGHGESDIQGVDYTYDPENRLVTAQDYYGNAHGDRLNGGVTNNEYDGEGRRLVKTYEAHQDDDGDERGDDGRQGVLSGEDGHEESDQTRVEYVFDGLLPVAEYPIRHTSDTDSDANRDHVTGATAHDTSDDGDSDDTGIPHINYYRGDLGRILEQSSFGGDDQGQTAWYHYDGLGSVSTLTQRSGARSANYSYGAYGQPKSQGGDSSKAGTHYTFTGQSWDGNTGLYEFYARPYDPATGTWLTQDPYRGQVQEPRSLQRYQYVYDSPVNLVDRYGHWPQFLDNAVKAVSNVTSSVVSGVTNWAKENQGTIAKIALTGAVLAGTALACGATAGLGCVIAAGVVGGVISSYGEQAIDNSWKDGQWTLNRQNLFDNINWWQVAADGVVSGITPVISSFGASRVVKFTGAKPKLFSKAWFGFSKDAGAPAKRLYTKLFGKNALRFAARSTVQLGIDQAISQGWKWVSPFEVDTQIENCH